MPRVNVQIAPHMPVVSRQPIQSGDGRKKQSLSALFFDTYSLQEWPGV
jgi:hypothetical protein